MSNMKPKFRVKQIINLRRKMLGALGESVVIKLLEAKGFRLLDRNYLVRQGELDLILERSDIIHFFEVKTVSCETMLGRGKNVIHETFHRPEDNVTRSKLQKISKTIQIYLERRKFTERQWKFHVATVYINRKARKSWVKFIKDIPVGYNVL